MPERPNGTVSKTVVPPGTVGSNPTLSATDMVAAREKRHWRRPLLLASTSVDLVRDAETLASQNTLASQRT